MAPQTEQKIYVGIGLDFETGGLDCRECACTQIALQAVRFDTWQDSATTANQSASAPTIAASAIAFKQTIFQEPFLHTF